MQGNGIVMPRISELLTQGQGDAVGSERIKCSVTGTMLNQSTGIAQDGFCPFVRIPSQRRYFQRRQIVDLFGIEHHGMKYFGSLQLHRFFFRLTVRTNDFAALLIGLVDFFSKLPILNDRALFAFTHLGTDCGSLFVCHPTWILPLLCQQPQIIDAAITATGNRIVGHVVWHTFTVPRLLPGSGSLLQLFDQFIGYLLVERFFGRHVMPPQPIFRPNR